MYKILILFRDQHAHIQPVIQVLKKNCDIIIDKTWTPEIISSLVPDLIIGINEFYSEIALCYERARDLGIPILTMQDGILEWRFMFENAIYNGNETGTPMLHPVLADKYACIGPLMAHHIGNLGNQCRVEVTGMPKMDKLGNSRIVGEKSLDTHPKKLLILTSSKPWFYENQKPVLMQALRDLKDYCDKSPSIEPIWRITKGLERELGVETNYANKDTDELAYHLEYCDAVVTTVSTTIIESMLMGKPVATLDYFNAPVMTPTVWNISCKQQIASTLERMLKPTPQLCWMQENYKHLLIRTDKSGAEVVAKLALDMIVFRKIYPDKQFPKNMSKFDWFTGTYEQPKLTDWYPKREIFNTEDHAGLRLKLARYERELAELSLRLNKRTLGGIIRDLYSKLLKLLRNGL